MILIREKFSRFGIFGTLSSDDNIEICKTLEHSYGLSDGFLPKVRNGIYPCKRGIHNLSKGTPFETFEVMRVPGHSGILFHSGNYNEDSDGCILIGEEIENDMMLLRSHLAFMSFMSILKGVESFSLTIM